MALFSQGDGTAELRMLVNRASAWLAPGGALVLEMAPHQAALMAEHARAAGYDDVVVHLDLAGRHRALVARRCP